MSNPFASPSLASFQGNSGKAWSDDSLMDVLIQHRGWIRFCGIISIIFGVFMVLGIWTIVVAWLPIWQGITLLNAASMLADGATMEMKHEATRKLALYFKLVGIFYIIYLVLLGLIMCFYIVMLVLVFASAAAR